MKKVISELFKNIEKTGEVELSEDFKKAIQGAFETVSEDAKKEAEGQLTLKEGEINSLKDLLGEAKSTIEEKEKEIEEIKTKTLDTIKEEVESWQEDLITKVDKFLDEEIERVVPKELIEAKAKIEIYEPIVEGFKSTLAEKGIEVDSEGHAVLKESKEEIVTLREDVNRLAEEKLQVEKKAEELLAKYILEKKCEGLTIEQKEKVVSIFKNDSVEKIEEKFDYVRDLVIGEAKKEEEDEAGEGKGGKVDESANQDTKIINEGEEDLGQDLI